MEHEVTGQLEFNGLTPGIDQVHREQRNQQDVDGTPRVPESF